MFEISNGCVSISRRTSTSRDHGTTFEWRNRLDWLIQEYPGDRFVLELLERIFCLLWMDGKQSMGEHGLNVESGFARGG